MTPSVKPSARENEDQSLSSTGRVTAGTFKLSFLKYVFILYPSLASLWLLPSFEPSHDPYFQVDNLFFFGYYCYICMHYVCVYAYI